MVYIWGVLVVEARGSWALNDIVLAPLGTESWRGTSINGIVGQPGTRLEHASLSRMTQGSRQTKNHQ